MHQGRWEEGEVGGGRDGRVCVRAEREVGGGCVRVERGVGGECCVRAEGEVGGCV